MGALTFRSVRIRRMPGIVDGGFALERLAGGVNIVFGPNASGKTTTARTVESLLWPRAAAPSEAWLEAHFEVDGSRWWVEVDAGRSVWQREGAEAAGPAVAPPEDRDRYRLSLHELLRADDAGFARSIMLESAGGYDLQAAARILNPRTTLSRPRREIDELRLAKERLKRARAIQEALYQQSLTLEPDETRLAERPAIEARRALLDLALEHDSRRGEARVLAERLERFPAVVGRLHGKEAEIVAGLRAGLAAAERDARKAGFDVSRLTDELSALDLTPEALERERLAALLNDVEELEAVHREVRVEDRRAAEEKARLDAESRRLGPAVDHESLGEIGAEEVEALSAAARSIQEARVERAITEAELRLLGDEVPTAERGRIDRAVFLLQQWLRQGGVAKVSPPEQRLALAAGVLLLLTGVVFSLLHLGALAIAAAGAVVLYLATRVREETDPRLAIEAEFATLRMEAAPERWELEDVRIAYSHFAERLEELRAEAARNERRQRLSAALGDLVTREETLRQRVNAVVEGLGIDPSHDEFRLAWTVEAISRWQKAEGDLVGALHARDRAWEQESDILARANQRLSEAGIEAAQTPQLLKAKVETLHAAVQKHDDLSARLAAARQAAALAQHRQSEVEAQLLDLFTSLDISPVDEPRLADWCEQRSGYTALEGKLAAVRNELERVRARITDLADEPELLLSRERASLEEEIPAVDARLAELDSIGVRVIQLKRDIENAKRGHDIEDAQADVERAETALRAARDRDISAAIAHALVTHVDRTSRDQHLPEVFHRASSIFARITHGRYTLRLDDSGSGAFRAYDTTSERSHALEELSSATRLQLLLAVRVAFIELQERGLRLPILMDETLANSDDDRAAAIMDAVLELAENGRQIFYFTAQPDEVRKWSAAMARRPTLEGRVIDLGVERKLERRLPPEALSVVDDAPPRYPSPGFLTHSAYASLLHVPPVDVFAPVGSLHLWYLIDEPETLHRVLQTLRTECWGQLDALAEHGGARLLGDALHAQVRALAEAAGVALSRLAVGRGLRVDRHALAASGAVSDRYIDQVAKLASDLGGNAEKLLAALGARAISGFRAASIQGLSSYLQENGYLDHRDSIDPASIRIEVVASVTGPLSRGELSIADIDGLLTRLFAGAGAPQLPSPDLPVGSGETGVGRKVESGPRPQAIPADAELMGAGRSAEETRPEPVVGEPPAVRGERMSPGSVGAHGAGETVQSTGNQDSARTGETLSPSGIYDPDRPVRAERVSVRGHREGAGQTTSPHSIEAADSAGVSTDSSATASNAADSARRAAAISGSPTAIPEDRGAFGPDTHPDRTDAGVEAAAISTEPVAEAELSSPEPAADPDTTLVPPGFAAGLEAVENGAEAEASSADLQADAVVGSIAPEAAAVSKSAVSAAESETEKLSGEMESDPVRAPMIPEVPSGTELVGNAAESVQSPGDKQSEPAAAPAAPAEEQSESALAPAGAEAGSVEPPTVEQELLIPVEELEQSAPPPAPRLQPRVTPGSPSPHPPRKREPVDTSHELKLL